MKVLPEGEAEELLSAGELAEAGVLLRCKPADFLTNDIARLAWYDMVNRKMVELGIAPSDDVKINAFCDACGVPD